MNVKINEIVRIPFEVSFGDQLLKLDNPEVFSVELPSGEFDANFPRPMFEENNKYFLNYQPVIPGNYKFYIRAKFNGQHIETMEEIRVYDGKTKIANMPYAEPR